jgi:hypothetical protein
MYTDRFLGNNFCEFFDALRTLDGNPTPTEMWRGLNARGLGISPTTIQLWMNGKSTPSDRYKLPIVEIFGLTESEFDTLREGSQHSSRATLIGQLVMSVVNGPLLNQAESSQLEDLIRNYSEELPSQLELF